MVLDERTERREKDERLERLLQQLADAPRLVTPVSDLVEMMASQEKRRR